MSAAFHVFSIARRERIVAAMLAGVMAFGLAACGRSSHADGTSPSDGAPAAGQGGFGRPSVTYSVDAPLNQAYGDALRDRAERMLRDGGHELLDAVIADGTISADEINEMQRRVIGCYADFDLVFTDEGSGQATIGTASGEPLTEGQSRKAQAQCDGIEGQFNLLATTYYQAVRNPDNADYDPYVLQCLQDHGILDRSYTLEQYKYDARNHVGPVFGLDDDGSDPQVALCQFDPLGNVGDRLPRNYLDAALER